MCGSSQTDTDKSPLRTSGSSKKDEGHTSLRKGKEPTKGQGKRGFKLETQEPVDPGDPSQVDPLSKIPR